MAKKVDIQKITVVAEMFRSEHHRDCVEVEFLRAGRIRKLSRIRFARNPATGRPTKRMTDCLDNGERVCYDKSVELW